MRKRCICVVVLLDISDARPSPSPSCDSGHQPCTLQTLLRPLYLIGRSVGSGSTQADMSTAVRSLGPAGLQVPLGLLTWRTLTSRCKRRPCAPCPEAAYSSNTPDADTTHGCSQFNQVSTSSLLLSSPLNMKALYADQS